MESRTAIRREVMMPPPDSSPWASSASISAASSASICPSSRPPWSGGSSASRSAASSGAICDTMAVRVASFSPEAAASAVAVSAAGERVRAARPLAKQTEDAVALLFPEAAHQVCEVRGVVAVEHQPQGRLVSSPQQLRAGVGQGLPLFQQASRLQPLFTPSRFRGAFDCAMAPAPLLLDMDRARWGSPKVGRAGNGRVTRLPIQRRGASEKALAGKNGDP